MAQANLKLVNQLKKINDLIYSSYSIIQFLIGHYADKYWKQNEEGYEFLECEENRILRNAIWVVQSIKALSKVCWRLCPKSEKCKEFSEEDTGCCEWQNKWGTFCVMGFLKFCDEIR